MTATADSYKTAKIVEKIPFFQGLSLSQIQQVLHAGKMESYPAEHILCRNGDKSNAMYILLSGELTVKDDGLELARVKPVEIVGEMGLVTGEPRCASIEVAKNATLMAIGKMHFDVFLKSDLDMAVKIYKNMLDSLSQKLRENNAQLKKIQSDDQLAVSVV